MENTQINGETPVLEETMETDVDNTTASSAPSGEESSGDDFISGVGEIDSVVEGDGSEEPHVNAGTSNQATETEILTETVVQTVEVLPEQPFAVYLVEEPEGNSGIEPYAVTGSPYLGSISSTYLDYFEGIADKLNFNEHYVLFRESQYEYTMFWGEELELSGDTFVGSDLSYCSINTGNYNTEHTVSWGTDSLRLNVGSGYVYSDLGEFASLTKGGTGLEMLAILFALAFGIVYNVCHDIFDYIMERVYRK